MSRTLVGIKSKILSIFKVNEDSKEFWVVLVWILAVDFLNKRVFKIVERRAKD
jgi:hypothetical protein